MTHGVSGELRLGPYVLIEPAGSGGMGTVWRGRHRITGATVAVKVLTRVAARKRQLRSAFRNEIRASAGLSHRAIVRVLDRGELPVEIEEASRGQLRAGSPYLVMQFVAGGSLVPWCGHLTWEEIRRIALEVLDGLAHAHARGLIHRDIKPANVLLNAERTEVCLTDFGLVHAVERATPGSRDRGLAGTPRYMAPEQCLGMWRDYGPWTDFYGLGGLLYALSTGYPPFAECQTRDELTHAHQHLLPPPLEPRSAVPDGFEAWLLKMLAKRPSDRFARASEAAAALQALDAPPPSPPASRRWEDQEDDIATDPAIAVGLRLGRPNTDTRLSTLMLDDDGRSGEHPSYVAIEPLGESLRDVPAQWGSDEPAGDLEQTGLGLYWLRSVPIVERRLERDVLWQSLRRVAQRGRAEVVVVHGPTGVGKSRLAEWLCQRAHEVAGADFLKGIHTPNNVAGGGLSTMLARYFRTLGLEPEATQRRIGRLLKAQDVNDPDEWKALAEFVQPSGHADVFQATAKVRFGSRWEALAVAQRAIERIASQRTTVVWLDDAHWSLEALLLVQQTLSDQDRSGRPVLFVLTVEDDALPGRPLEAAVLTELAQLEATTALRLGPLAAGAHETLVRRHLGLGPALARQVEQVTAGNPLFAVQLVGDWVDREVLEYGDDGLRLRVAVDMPSDLESLWASRVETFLAGRDADDGPSMELAAVLGQEITEAVWYAICEQVGLEPSPDLLDRLLDGGLARSSATGPAEGWAFAHGLIRDALIRRATAGGRLPDHHDACARHLGIEGGPGSTERIAGHLLDANKPLQALGMLAAGCWELIQQDELDRAAWLLQEFRRTLDELGIDEGDARRGQALLLEVRLLARSGDDQGFAQAATRAEAHARAMGWEDIVYYLGFELAAQHRRHGRAGLSWRALEAVERWAERRGDRALLASCLFEKGRTAGTLGLLPSAEDHTRRAFDLLDQLGDGIQAGKAMLLLAELAARQGEPERGEACLQSARDYFMNWGSRVGLADVARTRGLVCLIHGDDAAAEGHLRDAMTRYESLGSPEIGLAELGIGVLLVHRMAFEEAEPPLRRAAERFLAAGEGALAARAFVALLPGLAEVESWDLWDEHAEAARVLGGDRGFAEAEQVRCLEIAASLCRRLGEQARAERAESLIEPP